MANIHSQKKRILRAERERLENRRYTSTISTYFRRLESAVAEGDDATSDGEHRSFVDDRQGRQARRPASQHRRTQEGARRARPRRPALARVSSQGARIDELPALWDGFARLVRPGLGLSRSTGSS